MRNPWRGLAGLPREIWILFTANLVNRAGMMVLPMLIVYLTRQLGFSAARAGFIFAAFGITAIVIGPLAGRLSDRVGPLVLMRASLLLSGLIILFYPFARSYRSVVAVTVLWALASEIFRPASLAAITDVARPEQRKAAFAVHRLAINLGMSIGPAIGGFLATASFGAMFVVDGVTTIIAGIILSTATWRETKHAPSESSRWSDGVLAPRFLTFLFGVFLVGIVFFQHVGALPLFLVKNLGLSTAFYGLMFSINTLMVVVLEVPINAAMAHWKNRDSMALACLLFAVGFGSLAFVSTAKGVLVTTVIWTFGEIFLFPSLSAHIGDVAPPAQRGVYMGAQSMAMSSAFALGPWLGTAMLGRYGPAIAWPLMFAIGVTAAAIVALAMPPGPAPAAAAAAGS